MNVTDAGVTMSTVMNLTGDGATTAAAADAGFADSNDSSTADDAIWILTATYIIFTMQTGFGLLEAGCVQPKNQVNIMMKNALDVIFGGMAYWLFGYAFSYGSWEQSNGFAGVGDYAVDVGDDINRMGTVYINYVFQMSFATTATTIVSGAVAERVKLTSYIIFAFINVAIYSLPAHWVWDPRGFLLNLGCVDIAGSGVVHMNGGLIGLVATCILGPRTNRYRKGPGSPPLGNGTNAVVGTFMLWWGWMGFNCGSVLGMSGGRWRVAGKTAVNTLNASIAAGFCGVIVSYFISKRKFNVGDMINSVLGGLVAVTASCAVVRPFEAMIIGAIGGQVAIWGTRMFDRLHVDDPVGAVSVHGLAGIWGVFAVGLFMNDDKSFGLNNGQVGLFHGGGWYSLGVQVVFILCIGAWSAGTSFLVLMAIHMTLGLRMTPEEEEVGADYFEHNIGPKADEEYFSMEDDEEAIKATFEALRSRRQSAFGQKVQLGSMDDITLEVSPRQPRKTPINGVANMTIIYDSDCESIGRSAAASPAASPAAGAKHYKSNQLGRSPLAGPDTGTKHTKSEESNKLRVGWSPAASPAASPAVSPAVSPAASPAKPKKRAMFVVPDDVVATPPGTPSKARKRATFADEENTSVL